MFQNVYTYKNLHSVLEFCAPDCVLQDVFFRMCAPELVIFHLTYVTANSSYLAAESSIGIHSRK